MANSSLACDSGCRTVDVHAGHDYNFSVSSDSHSIVFRLAILLLVVGVGWLARRRGWLGEPATTVLSRICVDYCFPCLTFTQMLRIVGQRPLAEQGGILLLGAVLMSIALGAGGWGTRGVPAPLRRTAWLAAAMPNWIFLPLPVATLLYGANGLATVLLVNVVAQFYLWTTSVGILRGFRAAARSGGTLLLNPGLLATLAGAAVALAWPASRGWMDDTSIGGHALRLIESAGTLTIPLSMLVTGSQLGAIPRGWQLNEPLRRVMGARLALVPFITFATLWGLSQTMSLPPEVWRTAVLIAVMPVAVSCGVLVERFGGDRALIGQSILVTTLAALVTVPLFLWAAGLVFR